MSISYWDFISELSPSPPFLPPPYDFILHLHGDAEITIFIFLTPSSSSLPLPPSAYHSSSQLLQSLNFHSTLDYRVCAPKHQKANIKMKEIQQATIGETKESFMIWNTNTQSNFYCRLDNPESIKISQIGIEKKIKIHKGICGIYRIMWVQEEIMGLQKEITLLL